MMITGENTDCFHHCILIVTSVIPPELPIQMAMAVNNSLMTLMKMHFLARFVSPWPGKLNACLFDRLELYDDKMNLLAVGICQRKKKLKD
jgi:cation-transporting ATPase 13A1